MGHVLVIDNYDSFTFNLVQYLGELGANPTVARNDKISLDQIQEIDPSHIIISPGPKRPEDAGITMEIIKQFSPLGLPILGVCLGHQAIAAVFGGSIHRSPIPVHGKTSEIFHNKGSLYTGLPTPFTATRYHSLEVNPSLPRCLELRSWTQDGTVMGISHRHLPVEGVQFHPESILTEHGKKLLTNFLSRRGRGNKDGD